MTPVARLAPWAARVRNAMEVSVQGRSEKTPEIDGDPGHGGELGDDHDGFLVVFGLVAVEVDHGRDRTVADVEMDCAAGEVDRNDLHFTRPCRAPILMRRGRRERRMGDMAAPVRSRAASPSAWRIGPPDRHRPRSIYRCNRAARAAPRDRSQRNPSGSRSGIPPRPWREMDWLRAI